MTQGEKFRQKLFPILNDIWMYNSTAVMQAKGDFVKTLPICQEITEKDCAASHFVKLTQEILRLFAPLM